MLAAASELDGAGEIGAARVEGGGGAVLAASQRSWWCGRRGGGRREPVAHEAAALLPELGKKSGVRRGDGRADRGPNVQRDGGAAADSSSSRPASPT